MPRDERDIQQALDSLSARLGRIEARLGLPTPHMPQIEAAPEPSASFVAEVAPPPPQPSVVLPPSLPPIVPPQMPVSPPPAVPQGDRHNPLEDLARRKLAAQAAARSVPAPQPPPQSAPPVARPVAPPVFTTVVPPASHARPAAAYVPPTQPSRLSVKDGVTRSFEQFTFERLVGGRLYAIFGGLIVAIGLIMLLKYGIDHQWFSLPPALRCIGVGVIGLIMIGAGEIVRKRLGQAGTIAAAGISGAGIAAIYGSVLAAFGMYHLIGDAAAFVLLAAVSAGGVAYGLHARSLALAALSLVGAYLNPICLTLMGVKEANPLVMPAYLMALLVLGLTLAAWRPSPYRWLRGVAWWGTVIVGSSWLLGSGQNHPYIAFPFLGLVWCLVHAELYIGARRVSEATDVPLSAGRAATRVIRPMLSSFATTIWSIGAGILILQFTRSPIGLEEWHITCAGTIGTGVLAILLAGHLRAFRDPPETDAERLGIALWAQAGALLIATVALGLSNTTQTVAWLAMGLAAIGAGRWARGRALEGYGLIVLTIAVGRLLAWESWHVGGSPEYKLGLVLTGWTLLMLCAGAAWGGAAWMLLRPSDGSGRISDSRQTVVNICIGVGITLPFIGLLDRGAYGVSLASAGAIWGLLLIAASRLRASALLRYCGVAGLFAISAISTGMHLTSYGVDGWAVSVGPLALTDWGLLLLGLSAVWIGGAWFLGARGSRLGPMGTVVCIDMGVVMAMLSMVSDGSNSGAICIAWTAIAVVLVAAHARVRGLGLDLMGLIVLGLATLLWANEYLIQQEWYESRSAGLAHPGLWVAVVMSLAMIGSAAWLRRGQPIRATWWPSIPTSQAIAGLLLLVSTSLEVSRAGRVWFPTDQASQAGALTIWWGIFAVGMLVTGFAAAIPIVRHLGLALLGIATFKAVIFDLASVGQEWRIASFIGLGLLMLGVAVAYAKVSAKLDRLIKNDRAGVGGVGG